MYHLLVEHLNVFLQQVDVPTFDSGQPLPGADKLNIVGHWVLIIVTAMCVIGIALIGGKLALQHNHGEAQQHGKAFGFALAGCILVGSASGITAALI